MTYLPFLVFLIYAQVRAPVYWVAGDSEAGATYSALMNELPYGSRSFLTYETSSRIERWAGGKLTMSRPAGRIDHVILFLGTNNYDDRSLPSVRGVLNALPEGSRCTWVGPPKVNKRPFQLNNELKMAVSSRCAYVDSQKLSIQLRDGIHPTSQGARDWASAIVKEMR